jgi:hypothetical protein
MEPSFITQRGVIGPLVSLFKRVARKTVRWYVGPQFADLRNELAKVRDELAKVRKELEEVERLQTQAQAFALIHYRELHGRIDQMAPGADRVRDQAA